MIDRRPKVVQDRNGRKATDGYALTSQPSIALLIVFRLVAATMCFSINFDGQFTGGAEEIENVRSGRVLTPELHPQRSLTQFAP